MRTVYAIQFSISPTENGTLPVWERIRSEMRMWIEGKYAHVWDEELDLSLADERHSPLSGHLVDAQSTSTDAGDLLEVTWEHPDENDDGVLWHVAFALARNEEQLECSCALRLRAERFVVKPLGEYEVGRPRLISRILHGYPCDVAGSPVPTTVAEVDEHGITGFIDHLEDPHRTFPVVLVTAERDSTAPLVDPADLQEHLLGYANVVELETQDLTYEITAALGRRLSCFGGAIRLYWPGFTRHVDPLRHPLYVPDRLRGIQRGRGVANHLFGVLRRAAAVRHSRGELAERVTAAREAQREAEVRDLRERLDEHTLTNEELMDALESALDERDRLNRDLGEANDRIQELQEEVEAHKANLAVLYDYEEEEEVPAAEIGRAPVPDQFDSVLDVILTAADHFEYLEVWETAFESAEESHSTRTSEVFSAFEAIAELAEVYFPSLEGDESPGPWSDWFRNRGFKYASQESESTMNVYGDERVFTEGARQVEMQRHLTLGGGDRTNCVQIYFEPDADREVMQVGYCGPHLSFTSQGT